MTPLLLTKRGRTAAKKPVDAARRADPGSAEFALADSPLYLLVRTAARYELEMDEALRKVGMDLPSWRALMLVHERSPSSVSQISERSVSKLSTMTRVIQRLEERALVRLSQRESDARVTDVYITPAGERAARTVRETASRIYAVAMRDCSPGQIASLVSSLKLIYESLAGQPPD